MEQGPSKLDQLREEILTGRLNRRDVLKRAMVMGLSAPIIAGLLAACGSDDEEDEPEATNGTGGATATTGGSSAATATSGGDAAASPTAGGTDAATATT